MKKLLHINSIDPKIYLIRGQRVMIDRDLAELYGVPTKVLNQAISRNRDRFPEDFMFQLSEEEKNELVTNCDRFNSLKHSSSFPYAFTEQGIAMLSSVLKSKKAIWMNIQIMRAFVQIRQIALTHKELALQLKELGQKVGKHDEDIQSIITAIQQLIAYEEKPERRMGFNAD